MKIAVATKNGKIIADHFGQCAFFAIYEIKESKIASKHLRQNILSPHIGPCSKIRTIDAPEWVKPDSCHSVADELRDCDIAISQGIDEETRMKLASEGIRVIVTGHRKVQKAVRIFLSNEAKSRKEKIAVVDDPPVNQLLVFENQEA